MLPILYRTLSFFFITTPTTTEIYTLSLHDALPIFGVERLDPAMHHRDRHQEAAAGEADQGLHVARSEEHTSELQSHSDLVCRLLLEKKKKKNKNAKP